MLTNKNKIQPLAFFCTQLLSAFLNLLDGNISYPFQKKK
jgi:hypothetical protein